MKFEGEIIKMKSDFEVQIYYYSNRFFEKVFSSSQSEDLIVAFIGCIGDQCGVLHYNAKSTSLSSFSDFLFLGNNSSVNKDRLLFSRMDVISNENQFDSNPYFRGYMVALKNTVEDPLENFFNYKVKIVYPFKAHYN